MSDNTQPSFKRYMRPKLEQRTVNPDPVRTLAERLSARYNIHHWERDNVESLIHHHLGDALEEAETLRRTFAHTHVAARRGQAYPIDGYPDKCQQCGLDIRNAIHSRAAIDEARGVRMGDEA